MKAKINEVGNACHECGKDKQVKVQLGQEPDWESATATICLDCLKKAVELSMSVKLDDCQKERFYKDAEKYSAMLKAY